MPARTQNASQHVLTKHLMCQRRHKMHLNTCWPNPFHACEDTNASQNILTKYSYANMDTKFISHKIHQHALTKTFSSKCWLNPSLANENTKSFSNCVDQAETHKVNFCSLIPFNSSMETIWISTSVEQPLPCQRRYKIHLNFCCLNASLACEETKFYRTCVVKTHTLSVRTQFVSYMCWKNPSLASENTKLISAHVDQTASMPARP